MCQYEKQRVDILQKEIKYMEENETYVLTEWAIMQQVLCDFGIVVNRTVANAIFEEFIRRLEKSGYLKRNKNK